MATKTKGAKKSSAKKSAAKKPATTRESTNEKANGEIRPRAGGKTARVWEIADKLAAKAGGKHEKVSRQDVIAQAVHKEGASEPMTSTQFGRWRRFHGVFGRTPKDGAAPARKAAAKKAPKAAKAGKKAGAKKAASARKRAPKAPASVSTEQAEGGAEE